MLLPTIIDTLSISFPPDDIATLTKPRINNLAHMHGAICNDNEAANTVHYDCMLVTM